MKTFHYPQGHEDYSTLTVGELQAVLAQYPEDLPVIAEWEGQWLPFRESRICPASGQREFFIDVQTPTHWLPEDNVPCLVINVDSP